jgi:hypothetical protein
MLAAGRHATGWALWLVAVGALAACASKPPEPWTKPGVSEAELRRDLAECERDATGEGPFHFKAWAADWETTRARIEQRKRTCMEARGWRLAAAR